MNESNPSNPGALAGQIALVTGASSDIGGAIAAALAARGAGLILLGRDDARLGEVAAEARRLGQASIETHAVELTDERQVREWAEALAARHPRLDILVHAAGAYGRGDIADAAVDELDRQYQVNLRAPYLLTQALLPLLRQEGGDIVFVSSSQAGAAGRGVGAYAASQHGRSGFAESLRAEVNELGIRVLSVFLGRTAGRRQEQVFAAEGRPYAPEKLMQPADVAEMVAAALSLSRSAEVMSMSLRPALKSY